MVESLKELNKICQKPNYRQAGNLMVRYILRDLALPITWVLLHTGITANQVTLLSLLIGLSGISLFALVPAMWFFAGAVALQLWYLLDHVDGQIARYRKTASLTGRFFDFLTHHLIHPCIFFSLGIFMFQVSSIFFCIIWGFVLSMLILAFNLIHDAKSKAFIERLVSYELVRIMHASGATAQVDNKQPTPLILMRSAFKWIHKLCEIHVLMNILTVAAVLELIWNGFPARGLLFFTYSFLVPILVVGKISYIIVNQKCDQEFNSLFEAE